MAAYRKNRKKQPQGTKWRRLFRLPRGLMTVFRVIMGITILGAVSLGFIFVHDFLTQSDYFNAKNIEIQGLSRLTAGQIMNQARIHPGINIMAVNLSVVRNRLLAHPWIAEAEIRREIPAGLSIKIEEHVPIAIVDLGSKFLMNTKGAVFKEWETSDPSNLPIIAGLDMSDVTMHGDAVRTAGGILDYGHRTGDVTPVHSIPFEAVMKVLRLGRTSDSIIPNQRIKRIQVDREIGLTLYAALNQTRIINLGFNDYADKYQMLANLLTYLKKHRNLPDFDRIDLNNVNRVVVNPITFEPAAGDS